MGGRGAVGRQPSSVVGASRLCPRLCGDSDTAEFLYKTTDYWLPEHERSQLWNDPTVGVQWPITEAPQLAAKDAAGKALGEAEVFG